MNLQLGLEKPGRVEAGQTSLCECGLRNSLYGTHWDTALGFLLACMSQGICITSTKVRSFKNEGFRRECSGEKEVKLPFMTRASIIVHQ